MRIVLVPYFRLGFFISRVVKQAGEMMTVLNLYKKHMEKEEIVEPAKHTYINVLW